MSAISNTYNLKKSLHQSLKPLASIQECVLLDYPSYSNIGDHLIWLGTVFHLKNVLNISLRYCSDITNFSDQFLNKYGKKVPILFQGGGNFGDLWSGFQKFREQIISKYKNRPIFILPQSIYYKNIENLEKTAEIFNSHPDLTIFIRDKYSYEIAKEYLGNCRVIKSPDMALEMIGIPKLPLQDKKSDSILYLYRNDQEKDNKFKPSALNIPNLVVEDWVSFSWMCKIPENWIYIPGLVKLIREGYQRGLAVPSEFISRQKWENFHPYSQIFSSIYAPSIHRKSWSLMHSGIWQLQKYKVVITNRLHVHILCLILEIPHVLLPGSYYKIEAFYETWTKDLPLVKFVKEPSQVKVAVEDLYSNWREIF